MKHIILAALLATSAFASISSAYAEPFHHHRDCHKVRSHGHWVTRCR